MIVSSALAAVAAHVTAGEVIGHFAQEVIIALLIGWLAGEVMVWVRARVGSVTADTVLSLVTPFVAYLPANALHGSGLVAAVIAGLVVGREAPERLHSSHRVAAGQMWATLQLVLESTVFGLMGIQLPGILHDVARGELHFKLAAIVAGVGLVATIVVRAVMVVPLVLGSSRRNNRREQKRPRLELMNEMAGKMTEQVKNGPTP